jgi:hypothetical protein
MSGSGRGQFKAVSGYLPGETEEKPKRDGGSSGQELNTETPEDEVELLSI